MSRVRTQEDFIKRAEEVHGKLYDYSEVEYTKSSVPVTIICRIHGRFQQKPNKHLAGQGCKQCGRLRTKVGAEEFVRRAKVVHGNRYDYTHVVYDRSDRPVEIVCDIHGSFFQTPHAHVICGQGCPKCGAISGGLKRAGDANCQRKPDVKAKTQATCIARYGAKTYAESQEGRNRLREVVTAPDIAAKMQMTCLARYGTKTWPESAEGRSKLHEIMNSDAVVERIRNGYLSAYGVDHFMKTDEGRKLARQYIATQERRSAIERAVMEKYGVTSTLLVPSVRQKIDAKRDLILKKSWVTKRANGTFNSSKPEETLFSLLCDRFGRDNVQRQYDGDIRYPFCCDFYVTTLDLFIELNASWTHGEHWFDENNPLDNDKLSYWQYRCRCIGSQFYKSAIETWTRRDLLKRQYAERYALNYLVFWDNDLTDAKVWLESL